MWHMIYGEKGWIIDEAFCRTALATLGLLNTWVTVWIPECMKFWRTIREIYGHYGKLSELHFNVSLSSNRGEKVQNSIELSCIQDLTRNIEQNCLGNFISIQWTNRCHLTTICSLLSFQANTVRKPPEVYCMHFSLRNWYGIPSFPLEKC